MTGRNDGARLFQQETPGNAISQVIDLQHGASDSRSRLDPQMPQRQGHCLRSGLTTIDKWPKAGG